MSESLIGAINTMKTNVKMLMILFLMPITFISCSKYQSSVPNEAEEKSSVGLVLVKINKE
jgi:hypothetical protein